MALPSKWVVVSSPAVIRTKQVDSSSESVSRSSCAWVATRALIRSSPGSARRRRTRRARYSSYCPIAASDLSRSSLIRPKRRNQVLTCGRSSGGMPKSSQTTDSGSGEATASIRSMAGPAASASSTSRSTIRWMPSRRAATRRAVKARLASLRSRAWSGGSVLVITRPSRSVIRLKAFRSPPIAP